MSESNDMISAAEIQTRLRLSYIQGGEREALNAANYWYLRGCEEREDLTKVHAELTRLRSQEGKVTALVEAAKEAEMRLVAMGAQSTADKLFAALTSLQGNTPT